MSEPPVSSPEVAAPAVSLKSAPQVGDQIGAYHVESVIQQGGMGEVFLVRTDTGSSPVVLKRLPLHGDDEDGYTNMFRSEIEVMTRLRHPNIVAALDSFETREELCLTLEFVRGRNLLQIQRALGESGLGMSPGVAIYIMVQILEGLHYAHTFVLDDGRPMDLVHRDVTPGNILVAYDGAVKLTDFGIAKSVMSLQSTRVGVVKGTTRYLSPEQIRARPTTPRSDVFSAAVVLTELLTGKPLFDRGAVAPTLFAIVNRERPDVAKLLPFKAPELSMVLEGALASEPDARPPTARTLADGLRWAAQAQGWTEADEELRALMRRLFPEAETAPDKLPSTIKATAPRLDLTYLLEVSEPEPWTGSGPPPVEEELRALLQGMIAGSAPLDASQFAPASPSPLVPRNPSPAPGGDARTDRAPSTPAVVLPSVPVAVAPPSSAPPPVPPELSQDLPSAGPEHETPVEVRSRALLDALDHVSSEIEALDGAKPPPPDERPLTIPRVEIPPRPRRGRDAVALLVGVGLGFGAGQLLPLTGGSPGAPPPPAAEERAAPPPKAPPGAEPRKTGIPGGPPVARAPAPPPAKPAASAAKSSGSPGTAAPAAKPSAPPTTPSGPAAKAPAAAPRQAPAPPPKGARAKRGPSYLTVTRPRGARVYVDGARIRRRVPFKKVRIKKGRRLVKIVKRRYQRVFEIDLKPGMHLNVTGGRVRAIED